jgi:glycosyltransferase involved in cell wall biosynthesis
MTIQKNRPDVSIVIPLFNEEESFDLLTKRITELIDRQDQTF